MSQSISSSRPVHLLKTRCAPKCDQKIPEVDFLGNFNLRQRVHDFSFVELAMGQKENY